MGRLKGSMWPNRDDYFMWPDCWGEERELGGGEEEEEEVSAD